MSQGSNNGNNRSVSFAADLAQEEEEEEVVVEEEFQPKNNDHDHEEIVHDGDAEQEDDIEAQQKPAATTTTPPAPHERSHRAAQSQQQSQQQQQQQSQQQCCPNCGGGAIEQHEASGAAICTDCGVVVEENAIVSAVEFMEGAGGSSSMVGQFVSATSSKAYTGGGPGGAGAGGGRGGGRYGYSRDSRETTLANGRRRIQELAGRLRLGSHFVDGAHRLFAVAVEKNFVQGRRTAHVVAACLYIACRQEKSQHMLIDFSDALQVNVYTLGTCFLKFRRLLGLKLEIIDPALYVYRFAAHLDLDDKTNAVSLTALRLVARMKRDWIVAGRRPAGICAAALLIAARAHGLGRQSADVTRILRVCGVTVHSRLREFEQTPTALLALEQLGETNAGIDQHECDPPVYTRNKRLEARAKAIQEGNLALLTSGALDDDGRRGSKWREVLKKTKLTQRNAQFQELYESLEKSLMNDTSATSASDESNNRNDGDAAAKEDDQDADAAAATTRGGGGDTKVATDNQDTNEAIESIVLEAAAAAQKEQQQQQLTVTTTATTAAASAENIPEDWKKVYPQRQGKDLILPDEATEEEQLPPQVPTEAHISLDEWKQEMPASIDQEIEDMFRSEEEEKQKEAIFNKMNAEYLRQQERKEKERREQEAASKRQEEDDVAQAAGQARYKDHRSSKKRGAAPATTEEALRAAVASRKVSRKINYDALTSIFDDEGSFATDGAPDEDVGEEDLMFEVI